ncbi:7,8-didemethyl-8-hydroxy-5-deazariboflavin synthase, CofH subunit [Gaiella occulta]|uniref:FO synthase n=1 Tax=Gaiella occulta TaxID=1002870 RepID=A0A7M2YUP5_9ACTN|nr:5-amino-6-(D-ribitylamino)uracil--L-tyrosine 4-hydroxyphenyl transferase CofH [Gaiella occulta]RDI73725.1 7,8-didemethyl-8-hydroxy-5-deazariboflavin synthase, CofH subunit [Gaiella occulta]
MTDLVSELLSAPLDDLLAEARRLRAGPLVTYSPKVFVPLTTLCRDVCGYCTFARPPRRGERAFMTEDEVLAVARAGAAAGCTEALFTLGDKPELRYRSAREELAALGCATTLDYLARCARLVLDETGLLPHLNPGVMTRDEISMLRPVSASMGIMLETVSERLSRRGGPHWASPDKVPARRLETIRLAGELAVPFTSGILIGIGETREERIDALLALKRLGAELGHVGEVIVQNFRAKPGTRMAGHPDATMEEHLWSVAVARILLGPCWHVQAPPNLAYDDFPLLLDAGIDDWGGVSPVTIDHVNPEAPWPAIDRLREATASRGLELVPRLPLYPEYVADLERWVDPALQPAVRRASDALGLAREDRWAPGEPVAVPFLVRRDAPPLELAGEELGEAELVRLFSARGSERERVFAAADRLRREVCGDEVSYVVTRNIQYTNVCYFKCGFCAFSKGKLAENLRGPAYLVPMEEIVRRAQEAWARGATEVCLQGGIHPAFTGDYYAEVVAAIKAAVPEIHVHAFSALEVWQGAATLGVSLDDYLARLRDLGLGSLPGTAAEILDDEVRALICPDKVCTDQWLEVHDAAHRVGLRSNVTMMMGHVERPVHWARHLLRAREQQQHSGGFTEFVPLPFVPMEAPMFLKGRARRGPTFGEVLLVHAVARLALHPLITNVQVSWVKLGPDGVRQALAAGVNDLGGTLMNESISRAAGSEWGQELPPEQMEALIRSAGRVPRQRTTTYGVPPQEQVRRSFGAEPLAEPLNPPVRESGLKAPPRLVRPGLVGARAR